MDRNKDNVPSSPEQNSMLGKLITLAKSHLVLLIILAAGCMILFFIIGSITRAVQKNIYNNRIAQASSAIAQDKQDQHEEEAELLLEEAALLARHYDYSSAITLLKTFSGDVSEYPRIQRKLDEYTAAMTDLVPWSDPDTVLNLSFHNLIADPDRAFSDQRNGSTYKKSYVTTTEFISILQQLYNNDYILVRLSDFTSSSGAKTLYLPAGKKPVILTQTGVNYYTFTLDSDGDKLPDAGGCGFASKLVLDANGNITSQMVDSAGNTVYGAYDLVPILDSFVETHPGFSYKGAKAILAVTGYDGVFGYRTNQGAKETFGQEYYENEVKQATEIANTLRDSGYELACYTYANEPYTTLTPEQITDEMSLWKYEVYPILGFTNIFVFGKQSDIGAPEKPYKDEKLDILYSAGFRYYLGFCDDGEAWYSSHGSYIRQGRILVTGEAMSNTPAIFDGIFDPSSILDGARN